MRILGLDVCKNCVVGWLLTETPKRIKPYFLEEMKSHSHDKLKDHLTFFYNCRGMNEMLKLKPDAIALEPTGSHYSYLPYIVAKTNGIKVFWIGHQQVAGFRAQYKLPNKKDKTDAFALACYAQMLKDEPEAFLYYPIEKIEAIRTLYHQSKSRDKLLQMNISLLRANLAHDFPEAMDKMMSLKRDGRNGFICWLAQRERAGVRKHSRVENQYQKSVAVEYDIPISDFTRQTAKNIDTLHQEQFEAKQEMIKGLADPEFKEYTRVFNDLMFDVNLQVLLISLIYPIKAFPNSKKFKARIGLAKNQQHSGDTEKEVKGSGSAKARSQLYLWGTSYLAGRFGNGKRIPLTSVIGRKVMMKFDGFYFRLHYGIDLKAELEKKQRMRSQDKPLTFEERKQLESILKSGSTGDLKDWLASEQESKAKNLVLNYDGIPLKVKQKGEKSKLGKLILCKALGYLGTILYYELKNNC